MRNALPALMILLLSGSAICAQKKIVFGTIISSETEKPIPFVNIILPEKQTGTSADVNGVYSFGVDIGDMGKAVKLSCIGFKTRNLAVHDLINAEISLEPDTQALSTVEVYSLKRKKSAILNPFRSRQTIGLGNFSGGSYPSSLARYYKKPERFTGPCFLKTVEIKFFDAEGLLNRQAKFRFRILDVADNGEPGKDLLSENLIIQKKSNNLKIKVDLLDYKIRIPENGFFVAVEHLFIEENRYTETKDYIINDTLTYKNYSIERYAPIFTGVLENNDPSFKSFFKNTSGWEKMNNLDTANAVFEGKVPAPAFRVTLTD